MLMRIGTPFMGARHLGVCSVNGPRRLPMPAARMIAIRTGEHGPQCGCLSKMVLLCLDIYPSTNLWYTLSCTKLPGDVSRQTDTSTVVLDEQYLLDKPPRSPGAEATRGRHITQIDKVTSLPTGDPSPPTLQQYTAAAVLSNQVSGHFDYPLNPDSLLKEFYKGYLHAQGLWKRLKEFERQGKQFLSRDAYIKLKCSFKWKGLPIEFVEADDGAISVEFRERK